MPREKRELPATTVPKKNNGKAVAKVERAPLVAKRPLGRPSLYTPETASEILDFIANGGWVEHLDKPEHAGWPCARTVHEWCRVHDDFSHAYMRAIEERTHRYILQAVDESLDRTRDIHEFVDDKGNTQTRVSHAAVGRSKLIADTLFRLAEKHCPRIYGQRLEQEITAKGTITVMPVIELIHRAPTAIEAREED